MWAKVLNGQLIETIMIPKGITFNDIQYPKSIFTSAWTDAERKSINILPYVYSGNNKNDDFYSSTFSDSVGDDAVTRTYTTTTNNLAPIKVNKLVDSKIVTNNILSETDWYVVRKAETNTAIPSQITAYRTAVRANYAALKTAITNAANVPAMEAIYSYADSANSDKSVTVDGTSSDVINTSANSITSNGHAFVVGESLQYHNGGGADIGGLVDRTQYYVFSRTTNTFKLSHSHSNCGDAAAISLTAVAESGDSHTFNSVGIPGADNTWPHKESTIYSV